MKKIGKVTNVILIPHHVFATVNVETSPNNVETFKFEFPDITYVGQVHWNGQSIGFSALLESICSPGLGDIMIELNLSDDGVSRITNFTYEEKI